MPYDSVIHHRRSIRLREYDYSQAGCYFITICCQNRENYFGNIENGKMNLSHIGIIADVLWYEIGNHIPNVDLGEFVIMPNHIHGIIVITNDDLPIAAVGALHATPLPHVDVTAVGVLHATPLPHVDVTTMGALHATPLQCTDKNEYMSSIAPKSRTLSTIIRSYKSAVSKHAHRLEYGFKWQRNYYEHIIRDEQSYQHISEYIINNPKKWPDDRFYTPLPCAPSF